MYGDPELVLPLQGDADLHVEAEAGRYLLALGHIPQHFTYLACSSDGYRHAVVELCVVPVHLCKSQHFSRDVLQWLPKSLTVQH